MNKTPFKVLKLRSGDDVVARLIKNTKEFIRLERPMVIKVMHYVEPMGGDQKRNYCSLRLDENDNLKSH